MTLIVEDGTGKSDAESYVSVADCAAYADERGLSFAESPAPDAEAALRRATAWLDGAYAGRWPGDRLNGRSQSLQWPRSLAYDQDGLLIDDASVPAEVISATCEAAVRELAIPNTMTPDVTPNELIRSASVTGAVSVTYAGSVSVDGAIPALTAVDNLLAGIVGKRSVPGQAVSGKAARA